MTLFQSDNKVFSQMHFRYVKYFSLEVHNKCDDEAFDIIVIVLEWLCLQICI